MALTRRLTAPCAVPSRHGPHAPPAIRRPVPAQGVCRRRPRRLAAGLPRHLAGPPQGELALVIRGPGDHQRRQVSRLLPCQVVGPDKAQVVLDGVDRRQVQEVGLRPADAHRREPSRRPGPSPVP